MNSNENMKSEGWKYFLLGLGLITLLVLGVVVVRPVSWLEASQYNLTGFLELGSERYEFNGENALVINNLRQIEGNAISSGNKSVSFNTDGAEVKLDQLGYLQGNLVLEDGSIISLDNKGVKIVEGFLDGDFASQFGLVKLSGETKWRPYQISEIKVNDQIKLEVNKKTRIDAEVLALGGKKLTDVGTQWISNDSRLVVDENGYVTALESGDFSNGIVLKIADREEAISLQATETIKLSTAKNPPVVPNLVEQNSTKKITVYIEPVDRIADVNGFRFIRGNSEVICSGFTKGGDGSISASGCNFAGVGAGDWNLELTTTDGEYVFLSELRVVNSENALNVVVNTKLFNSDTQTECAVSQQQTTLYDNCDQVRYTVSIDEPSYLIDRNVSSGDIRMVFKIDGKAPCQAKKNDFSLVGAKYDDTTKEFKSALTITDGKIVNPEINLVFISTFYQGCDLAADIYLENMNFDGLVLYASSKARVGIGYPKQVELSGDVVVEQGNIDIESTSDDAKSFSLVAQDSIKLVNDQQNQLVGYEISSKANFADIVARLKENLNKLIIERGVLNINSTDIGDNLKKFTNDSRAKYPEGRIIYDGNEVGDYILQDRGGTDVLNVCGPVTLVVEGRDVYINDDIKMSEVSAGVGGCAQKGNFGLIVLDGNIYVDPAVTDINGYYFTTGTFYTGANDQQFVLTGVAVANNFVLQRY